VKDLLVRQ